MITQASAVHYQCNIGQITDSDSDHCKPKASSVNMYTLFSLLCCHNCVDEDLF